MLQPLAEAALDRWPRGQLPTASKGEALTKVARAKFAATIIDLIVTMLDYLLDSMWIWEYISDVITNDLNIKRME